MVRIVELTGTSTAGGALTINADKPAHGYLEKITMDYDDGATGADLVFTNVHAVVEPLLTITNAGTSDITWYPRTLASKVADGTAYTDVFAKIFCTGKLRVVVAQGGNAKNFRFLAFFTDE